MIVFIISILNEQEIKRNGCEEFFLRSNLSNDDVISA